MLGGIGSANPDVELVATIAGTDDDGPADEAAKGFEDLPAQLLQHGNVLRRHTVVNAKGGGGGRIY